MSKNCNRKGKECEHLVRKTIGDRREEKEEGQ